MLSEPRKHQILPDLPPRPRRPRAAPTLTPEALRLVRSDEAQNILRGCRGGDPVGNANMATMLELFRLKLINARGTTASGRALIR